MTDDDEISDLMDDFEEFKEQHQDGGADDDADDDGDVDLEGEMGEVFDEAFDEMMPDNPGLLDLELEDAMVEADDDDGFDSGDDQDDDDDDVVDADACWGSPASQLSPLGESGDVQIMLNYIVSDAIQDQTVVSSEPTENQLADLHPILRDEVDVNDDLNSDQFVGSREKMLEVHWDEEDFEDVHEAIAHALHPTEEKLRRDPDAEITPESLLKVRRNSCHSDYDETRTFNLSRDGDSDVFVRRGPWTGRQFDVQDIIDELLKVDAKSDDGIMVVTHAVPFK